MSATRPVRTYSKRQMMKPASKNGGQASSRPLASSSGRTLDEGKRPGKRSASSLEDDDSDSADNAISWIQKRAKPISHESQTATRSPSPDFDSIPPQPSKSAKRSRAAAVDKQSSRTPDLEAEGSQAPSLPSTPKRPKDLTKIFDTFSPYSTPRSQKANALNRSPSSVGKAKRMLSRSKTDSSVEKSPTRDPTAIAKSKSLMARTNSQAEDLFDNASPSRKQASGSFSRTTSLSESQSQGREIGSAGPRRTYAGASRSFLVSIPTTSVGPDGNVKLLADTTDDTMEEYRASYTELRKRYGIDNSEGDLGGDADAERLDEGLALYNPLSSITDLRSKGESRRFMDEMGYLLEGLDPQAELSVRRSSALDIVGKLCDQSFWRKARAAGLIGEIWDQLRKAGAGNGDKVLDVILSCYVALASDDARDVSALAGRDDFIEIVVRLLDAYMRSDPMSCGKVKLSKVEWALIQKASKNISEKEGIVSDGCSPSIRLLLSKTLSIKPFLIFQDIETVLESLQSEFEGISADLASTRIGQAFGSNRTDDDTKPFCFGYICNCLAILDAYLLQVAGSDDPDILTKDDMERQYAWLADGLVEMTAMAYSMGRDGVNDDQQSLLAECSDLAFRILINLSNNNPFWCKSISSSSYTLPIIIHLAASSHVLVMSAFSKKGLVADDEDTLGRPMDRLCLVLALLTNLLQELENLARSLLKIMYSPSCSCKGNALLRCSCENPATSISAIVRMYTSLLDVDEDKTPPDLHFLRGHLAVLMGLLILQLKPAASPSKSKTKGAKNTADLILDDLPGTSAHRKLDMLISNIEAFAQVYASVTQKIANGNLHGATGGEDSDPMRSLNADKDDSKPDVVLDVISSLRAIRNDL